MTKAEIEELLKAIRSEGEPGSGGVEVMKASAGSGKTFSLAREYIRLLLLEKDPKVKAHRHILAVTFTNKATDEMKTRIVKDLYKLSTNPLGCDYHDYLLEKCCIGGLDELRAAASKALTDILTDYGLFSVSTIDSFFQQTLRAFAREIGQFAEYKVELDRNSLVAESVDRVLDSLSEGNEALLRWLSESSIEKIESGEGYHLESSMSEFADGYLSNTYKNKLETFAIDEKKAFSEENIKKLIAVCRRCIRDFESGFSKAVSDADIFFRSFSCHEEAFTSNLRKKIAELLRYDGGKLSFGADLPKGAADGSAVVKNRYLKSFDQSDFDAIRQKCADIIAYGGQPFKVYKTVRTLLDQVYVFRVAETLRSEFEALLDEKNVLSLDDTNTILRDIISNSDAPFIYEKIGTNYKHFLLDEFQDTSFIQWENFRPLLINSISDGFYNLIVGDVKQSIYRWRDADWRILGEQVSTQLDRTVENPLDTNWRSTRNVIDFNNSFYASLASHIGVEKLYADVKQEFSGKFPEPGCVDVVFCSKDLFYQSVVSAVEDASYRGFRYKDMAVIVRTNAQGAKVASSLMAAGIHVITNDSLRISSGPTVRQLVSGLFMLDDPDDKINTWLAPVFDFTLLERTRSLTEMADELLKQLPHEQVNADTLYVLAFMDLMRDFVSRNGNSLHAFLEYWQNEGVRRTISSPEGSDAVTIITIHKCKGLSYPFVVVPIPDSNNFMTGRDKSWEAPDVKGTELEQCAGALYHVGLSSQLEDTLFSEAYTREKEMCLVDSANTWYVATTRAEKEMCIVSPKPSGNAMIFKGAGWVETKNIADALYMHVVGDDPHSEDGMMSFRRVESDLEEPLADKQFYEHYQYGQPVVLKEKEKEEKEEGPKVKLIYSPEGVCQDIRGNIRISNDAAEFFQGETEMSPRKKGIVLHGILENVYAPSDLHDAVQAAVMAGELDAEQAEESEKMLSVAIAAVEDRGWFPGDKDKILDEADIIVPGGDDIRPDRVVRRPDGGIDIVDYKFGSYHASYKHQIRKYLDAFRKMGYSNVNAYLWFFETGQIMCPAA